MKAVINERYGSPDILDIHEIPRPEPNAGEILVKVVPAENIIVSFSRSFHAMTITL
jgi:NADPH:quinone reductase-like Zn-dependent oxidoreductase